MTTKSKPQAPDQVSPNEPWRAVTERVADLSAAVRRLPFAGSDQANRADELVEKLGHELRSLELDGRTVVRRAGASFETTDAASSRETR